MSHAVNKSHNTYIMGSDRRKSPSHRNRSDERAISGWRSSGISVTSCTSVISKKSFDVRVWAGVLAQLMLPVETENSRIRKTKKNIIEYGKSH